MESDADRYEEEELLGSMARSIQMGMLTSQFTTKAHPERSIAHVHYLFLLTVQLVQGHSIPEVREQLPLLLRKGLLLVTSKLVPKHCSS